MSSNSKHVIYKNLDGSYSHADRVFVENANDIVPKTTFNEVAVASPGDIIYINFPYHISSGLCITSGLFSPTFTVVSGMAKVSTSSSGNSKAVLRTKRILPYVPGQATIVRLNGYFSSGLASQKQMIGYGDERDGYFFGVSGSTFGIWTRGFGVEEFISQSGWSEDRFDGTNGQSNLLDFTKGNAYAIQYPCICFGEVKFFVGNPDTGKGTIVHRIHTANHSSAPAIHAPALPLRVEVDNNGNAASCSVHNVSMYVARYGDEPDFMAFGASGATITSSDAVHILTISGVQTFYNQDNRKTIELTALSIGVNGGNEVQFEVYKNASGVTGTTMLPVDSNDSVVYYSTAGSLGALSGALVGSLAPRNSAITIHLDDIGIRLYRNETISIIARRTAAGSLPVYAFLNWKEYI